MENRYSLYLVGSRARGDENAHSDTDYVCIYDSIKPGLDMPRQCSISYYSFGKMAWMVRNSKLFVTHIKNDGITIIESPLHRELLDSFKVNLRILNQDVKNFRRMVKQLTWIPDGINGRLWASDYLYFLSRNIVYIENALRDVYLFGYEEAIRSFLSEKKRPELAKDFLLLRNAKYHYRIGSINVDVPEIKVLERISEVLAERTCPIMIGGTSSFEGIQKNSYQMLRLIERAIVNEEIKDHGFLDKIKNHSGYYFSLRRLADSILNDFHDKKETPKNTQLVTNSVM